MTDAYSGSSFAEIPLLKSRDSSRRQSVKNADKPDGFGSIVDKILHFAGFLSPSVTQFPILSLDPILSEESARNVNSSERFAGSFPPLS